MIEENKHNFEPDGDALTEALEFLRNNPGQTVHSYDVLNEQENADMGSEMQDDPAPEESFNEQLPSHLSTSPETNHQ